MNLIITFTLLITGIIHLLPAVGVFGADRLQVLYGMSVEDESLVLLMRHRAVLFALLGAFFVYAAFTPAYRSLAFVAGLVSVVSFLLLAEPWHTTGSVSVPAIQRVVQADVVALICLVLGGVVHIIQRTGE